MIVSWDRARDREPGPGSEPPIQILVFLHVVNFRLLTPGPWTVGIWAAYGVNFSEC